MVRDYVIIYPLDFKPLLVVATSKDEKPLVPLILHE